MPVASRKPTAQPPVESNTPVIQPPAYKAIVTDERVTPFESLLRFVSGSSWTVNYYSQVVSKHNDLREHDPGQLGMYQQYTKIVNLEIRVGTPIDSSQDSDSALVKVTGNGTVYGFLVPNVGDLFLASVGDGEDGLFRVTNTERRNFNRDSVFGIDYELVGYVSANSDRFKDLENKVNNTLYFDKTRVTDHAAPVLQEEEYKQLGSLKSIYRDLVRFYFHTFYSKECGTLMVPGQSAAVYDAFIVDYLLKVVSSDDAPEIRQTTNVSIGQDVYLSQNTFWDALLKGDHGMLGFVSREVGLVNRHSFTVNPTVKGLRFARMQYIVYPRSHDRSTLIKDRPEPEYESMQMLESPRNGIGDLAAYIGNQVVQQNSTVPMIHQVLDHETYVFSPAFYDGTGGQSMLESLTTDYLKGKMVDVSKLTQLVTNYKRWGRLEQFYYLPVLITLVKVATGSLY